MQMHCLQGSIAVGHAAAPSSLHQHTTGTALVAPLAQLGGHAQQLGMQIVLKLCQISCKLAGLQQVATF